MAGITGIGSRGLRIWAILRRLFVRSMVCSFLFLFLRWIVVLVVVVLLLRDHRLTRIIDGDLNNLLKKANYDRSRVRALVKEFRGFGDLAVDIFFDNVQSVWPSIAPFIDRRSLNTAAETGIGTDLDAIYAELGHDPLEISKLASGLSLVRLEKKVGEVE